jgi:predicted HTH transcriptional regulator
LIPERIEDWDLQTLNKLVTLRDIERESFDFKGPKFQDLSDHICAMANTAGGYLVLGIDENKNATTGYLIGHIRRRIFIVKKY